MIVAILAPGHSLSELKSIPQCDLSIGVNRVALNFSVDWWATLDIPFIQENTGRIKGSPKLFTREEYRRDTGASLTVEDMDEWCPDIHDLALYTSPATLICAGFLGAKLIKCYGCDMSGTGGSDGVSNDSRSEPRWIRERALFARATKFLQSKDIAVIRVSPCY